MYRESYWNDQTYEWKIDRNDRIDDMAQFPKELRKDLISSTILFFNKSKANFINGTSSGVENGLVYFHRSTYSGDYSGSIVSSCFTFQSPVKTLAGESYQVFKTIDSAKIMQSAVTLTQPGKCVVKTKTAKGCHCRLLSLQTHISEIRYRFLNRFYLADHNSNKCHPCKMD